MCVVGYIAAFVNIMITCLCMSSCLRPWHPIIVVGMLLCRWAWFSIFCSLYGMFTWVVSHLLRMVTFLTCTLDYAFPYLFHASYVWVTSCFPDDFLSRYLNFPYFMICYDCIASFMIFRLILFFHEYICFVSYAYPSWSFELCIVWLLTILYW